MSSFIAILCCLSATLYSTAAQVGGELTRYYNSSLTIKESVPKSSIVHGHKLFDIFMYICVNIRSVDDSNK